MRRYRENIKNNKISDIDLTNEEEIVLEHEEKLVVGKKTFCHNSQIAGPLTLNVPRRETETTNEEKLQHRKELSKIYSKNYRDKLRAEKLVDRQRNVIHNSQIAGPSRLDVPYISRNHINAIDNSQISISGDETYTQNVHNSNTTNIAHVEEIGDLHHENIDNNISQMDNLQNIENEHFIRRPLNLHSHTYTSFNSHSSAHREFQKQFLENDFGHAYDICDRLWFKNDLKRIINDDNTPNIQFIRTMLTNINLSEIKICSTCYTSINKNNIPPLSVYNGFKYPTVPDNLKNFKLDLVTERLISPRIPFMQIRRLRHVNGQYGIYGQVINVPIEVDTMVNRLPRNVDDDHCITVHIKRKKIHKSSYVYGMVNKRVVKVWLRYLLTTPLYMTYNITVDDNFSITIIKDKM